MPLCSLYDLAPAVLVVIPLLPAEVSQTIFMTSAVLGVHYQQKPADGVSVAWRWGQVATGTRYFTQHSEVSRLNPGQLVRWYLTSDQQPDKNRNNMFNMRQSAECPVLNSTSKVESHCYVKYGFNVGSGKFPLLAAQQKQRRVLKSVYCSAHHGFAMIDLYIRTCSFSMAETHQHWYLVKNILILLLTF